MLETPVYPFVYDQSGGVMRPMVAPSSGSNALLTSTNTPPTYIAFGDNVVPTSGGVALAMAYRSGGQTLVVKKMFISNIEPALASGQYLRFDICRISGLFSGGTAISAFPHDPTDAISGSSINIATAVTASLFPSAARNILLPWVTTTRGMMSGGTTPAPEAGTANSLMQTINVLPESPEMKEIRLTSGYGLMVQQTLAQTGYTQVTSGRYGITVVFTVQ